MFKMENTEGHPWEKSPMNAHTYSEEMKYDRNTFLYKLIEHEGMVLTVYEDSLGIETIGIGRNLKDRGITPAELEYMDIPNMAIVYTMAMLGMSMYSSSAGVMPRSLRLRPMPIVSMPKLSSYTVRTIPSCSISLYRNVFLSYFISSLYVCAFIGLFSHG